jgi:predicted protein tyrosine phosphatase
MYKITENLATCSLMESLTPEGWIIVDVRDLSDVSTDVKAIGKKIETIANLMAIGHNVCVRCVGGINRSNAIALGVLCYLYPQGDVDETWDYHFKFLKTKVGRAHITPNIERTIKKFLNAYMLKTS